MIRQLWQSPLAAWMKRHRRPLLLGALLAIFVWQWAITLRDARDFGVYYTAGGRMITGAELYDSSDFTKLSYKYSPVLAFLFVPFSLLPLKLAQTAWFAVNFLLTIALPPLALALVGARGEHQGSQGARSADHRLLVYALALALSQRYVLLNATAGQVVALQLALALSGLLLLERDRLLAGGALLGLAIMVKISPMLLLGYLLLQRRWKAIGVTVVATAAWALVPALRYGFIENIRVHLRWLEFIQEGNTLDQLVRSQNQSLLSLVTRFLVETPYGMNIVDLPLERVTPLYGPALFGGFFVLLAVLHTWLRRGAGEDKADRAAVSLVAILMYMTVFSPLAWRYNYLTVIVAWVFVADRVLRGLRTRRTWILVGTSVALGALTTRDFVGRGLETWTHVAGVEMWAGILAVYACVDLVRTRAAAAPAAPAFTLRP